MANKKTTTTTTTTTTTNDHNSNNTNTNTNTNAINNSNDNHNHNHNHNRNANVRLRPARAPWRLRGPSTATPSIYNDDPDLDTYHDVKQHDKCDMQQLYAYTTPTLTRIMM